MFKKDYLIKQFEEFGKVLASILKFKKEGDFDKFEQEIALCFKQFTDKDLKVIEGMTREAFEKEILGDQSLSFSRKKIMAAVLFEKMNLYEHLELSEQAENVKLKSLLLYQHIQDNSTENEYDLDVHYKLAYLKNLPSPN